MKKILSTFIIGFIGLISFCSAETGNLTKGVEQTRGNQDYYITEDTTVSVSNGTTAFFHNNSDYDIVLCVINKDSTSVQGYYAQGSFSINGGSNNHLCYFMPYSENTRYSYMYGGAFQVDITLVSSPMTSLDCQSEYNLIPISSVDSNYCEVNDLCSSSSCTGDNWSALLINDEQYDSAGIINVSIPSDYGFDYDNDGDQVDLTIDGYNVDTDYIEGIISNQKSKPNQTDLNNIITGVLPLFVPGLVIILFIYFIFKFLKKIF